MPNAEAKQLCDSMLMIVSQLRSWVKQVVDDPGDGEPTFGDLCMMSEQLLSAATELTSLAIQVTQAAQVVHNNGKQK